MKPKILLSWVCWGVSLSQNQPDTDLNQVDIACFRHGPDRVRAEWATMNPKIVLSRSCWGVSQSQNQPDTVFQTSRCRMRQCNPNITFSRLLRCEPVSKSAGHSIPTQVVKGVFQFCRYPEYSDGVYEVKFPYFYENWTQNYKAIYE